MRPEPGTEPGSSRTHENLRKAFAEEAALAFRCLYYATLAEFEGLERQAALFKEIAEGGANRVHGCLDFLKQAEDPDSGLRIGGTFKNLEALLQQASRQQDREYPEMARVAREEGFADVASWFETLAKAKRSHARKLKRLSHG